MRLLEVVVGLETASAVAALAPDDLPWELGETSRLGTKVSRSFYDDPDENDANEPAPEAAT